MLLAFYFYFKDLRPVPDVCGRGERGGGGGGGGGEGKRECRITI